MHIAQPSLQYGCDFNNSTGIDYKYHRMKTISSDFTIQNYSFMFIEQSVIFHSISADRTWS